MAVSPLGGVIYANQSAPIASHAQQQVQGRIDFQNAMTSELAAEEKKEIEKTRPPEETSKTDEDREHQKQQADQQEQNKEEAKKAIPKEPDMPPRLLDIKI